jgi:hypothetical protein
VGRQQLLLNDAILDASGVAGLSEGSVIYMVVLEVKQDVCFSSTKSRHMNVGNNGKTVTMERDGDATVLLESFPLPQTLRFRVGKKGAGKEIIIGVTSNKSTDWLGRSGTAMLSSKGLAKGGGKNFHKAGNVWHAGDVVEMTVHENNHVVFSLNTVLVFEVHKIKAQNAAVSMWSSGTSLQILN